LYGSDGPHTLAGSAARPSAAKPNVLAWERAVMVDGQFCLDALETALGLSTSEIFNSDQGAQFTAPPSTDLIKAVGESRRTLSEPFSPFESKLV